MKTINNDYDALAHLWWSEEEGASATIRYLGNPARLAYFQRVIQRYFMADYQNKTALEVGCGGGLLTEELCKFGLSVTELDPSHESICVAKQHAQDNGLNIVYQTGYGENLPFPDNTFDMVFCCDVLEHVKDVSKVVSEISRVLNSKGLFFYDTINRTITSKIIVIYLLQQCRYTAFCFPGCHVWGMFIKPRELESIMAQHSLTNKEIKGITPKHKGISIIYNLYKAAKKIISYQELAQSLEITESNNLNCSYMGYGIKTAIPNLTHSV